MRVAFLCVVAACGAAQKKSAYVAPVGSTVEPTQPVLGAALDKRWDSVDAFCAPIAAEEATPSNDACEHEHGSCGSSLAKNIAPIHASIVTWTHGSSIDRRQDVAIETPRGAYFIGMDLTVKTCDPEEAGAPDGEVALSVDRGALVATWDVFQRSVRVAPDSPPSKKQTCTIRCDARDVPRCSKPSCGEWVDTD
jgi:hypothetical protein